MTLTVAKPAVLVHYFYAARDVISGGAAAQGLRAAWNAAVEFGMDQSIGQLPVDLGTPSGAAYLDRVLMLGARQRDSADGVEQVAAFQSHDVVGCSVMLAPSGGEWVELDRTWSANSSARAGALGSATLFLGLVSERAAEGSSGSLARRIRPMLPHPIDGPWPSTGCVYRDGIVVWELPANKASPVAAHRRLLAVAPAASEDSLDRWLWSDDEPGLVPLTRYLLHAAKLRYEHQVLVRDLETIRRTATDADARCAELTAVLSTGGPVAPGILRRAGRSLADLQADATSLVTSLSRIRIMTRTVETAQQNMAAALPAADARPPGSMPDNDRRVGRWLVDQLRSEETYLDAANERISQLTAVGRIVVETGTRERQEHLTLLQTSLLGCLLTALAAIQSLQYAVPVPAPLQAPLIALLAAIALWLPSGVLNWPPGSRKQPGWRLLDPLLLASAVAALGWLAVGVGWWITGSGVAPWPWSVAVAGGFGLATAVVVLVRRR